MADLKYRPKDLMSFLSLVRGVLGVFHLVAELKERILDVLKPIGRWFAIPSGSDRRHHCYSHSFQETRPAEIIGGVEIALI